MFCDQAPEFDRFFRMPRTDAEIARFGKRYTMCVPRATWAGRLSCQVKRFTVREVQMAPDIQGLPQGFKADLQNRAEGSNSAR